MTCLNFVMNKDTVTSPLLSAMTSGRDTDDEGTHEFRLNGESLPKDPKLSSHDSYLSSGSMFKLNVSTPPSVSNSPEIQPIRLSNIFSKPSSFSGLPLNKRQMKEETLKKRSMSYDLNGNQCVCGCCGKKDISVLPVQTPNAFNKSYLCAKCSSALKKKQDYAAANDGTAKISEKAPNLVEFTCEKGHSWTVNIHRVYKSWCATCRKLLREEKRRNFKQQSSKVDKENADKQEKLFSEAKSHSIVDSQTEAPLFLGNFDDLFTPILPLAKAKADSFVNQSSPSPCTYEHALCVYKVLELDESRVQYILKGMSADSKRAGYKKLAIALHPDKNRHPLSKEAFQKASELFN